MLIQQEIEPNTCAKVLKSAATLRTSFPAEPKLVANSYSVKDSFAPVAAAPSMLPAIDKGSILIVRHQILKNRTIAELVEDLATILKYIYVETEKS